jgi:hypothetical protein
MAERAATPVAAMGVTAPVAAATAVVTAPVVKMVEVVAPAVEAAPVEAVVEVAVAISDHTQVAQRFTDGPRQWAVLFKSPPALFLFVQPAVSFG